MSNSTIIKAERGAELRKIEVVGMSPFFEIFVDGEFCSRQTNQKEAEKLFKDFCY